MEIATVVLATLFLVLGALPTVAEGVVAGALRERLPESAVQVDLTAVPTWKMLGGRVDGVDLHLGNLTVGGLPLQAVRVQSGPAGMSGPVRLLVDVQVPVPALKQLLEEEANRYIADLAGQYGLPGATVQDVDVRIDGGETPLSVLGRVTAFGGLVAMDLAIGGQPAFLPGNKLGLSPAYVSVNGNRHRLASLPLMTLPELPGGVGFDLTGLQRVDDLVAVGIRVDGPNVAALRQLFGTPPAGPAEPTAGPPAPKQ